jgi:hypothetical protein
VWPLSRDPWKDLTNSHTVANTVWGTNSDLHLLPGLKPLDPRVRLQFQGVSRTVKDLLGPMGPHARRWALQAGEARDQRPGPDRFCLRGKLWVMQPEIMSPDPGNRASRPAVCCARTVCIWSATASDLPFSPTTNSTSRRFSESPRNYHTQDRGPSIGRASVVSHIGHGSTGKPRAGAIDGRTAC